MQPSYNTDSSTITIPSTPGVIYTIDDKPVSGSVVIDKTTVVKAKPKPPARFRDGIVTEWEFTLSGAAKQVQDSPSIEAEAKDPVEAKVEKE